MKKLCAWAALLSILFSVVPAFASQPEIDKESIYKKALAFVHLEEYELALELFENKELDSYADCSNWRMYCTGMAAIRKANDLEAEGHIREAEAEIRQALSIFEYLSPIDFNGNSGNLYTYCIARMDEYGSTEFPQKAFDLYAKLNGTEDSAERYFRLMRGGTLPTQAPYTVTLGVVPAHAKSSIETLLGPAKKYMPQAILQVDQFVDLCICGKEGEYYLIEVRKDEICLRCWALARRIQADAAGDIPRVGVNGRKSTVEKLSQAYYGPGEEYAKFDYTISAGTIVTAYEAEGMYTMIECSPERLGKPVRIWVRTDALSRN